jgi:hypothetical protein
MGIDKNQSSWDLDAEIYGSMTVDFEYVVKQIRKTPAKILRFRSGSWWEHQDEWAIQKPATS